MIQLDTTNSPSSILMNPSWTDIEGVMAIIPTEFQSISLRQDSTASCFAYCLKAIQPLPFSSAASLLKFAGTWLGDDAEERLQEILDNRTPTRFD